MAKVDILHEVRTNNIDDWNLCFQWCHYHYDNGSNEYGYRFIWRRPNDYLQAARGQARIPSYKLMKELIAKAEQAGWLGSEEH